MIGIYDCFGYGPGYDVSFETRYRLIKNAGFDCVMLWWSDKFGRGTGYQNDVQFARDATSLEPMNWDYEKLSIEQFLNTAYQRAKKIDDMRT